jgi:cobalt-zinc-cadmium efflux system membrane fusion protein
MTYKHLWPFSRYAYISLIGLLFIFNTCGNRPPSAEKSQAPAKVKNAVEEATLSTITLSPEAEERLGIEVIRTEYRIVPQSLELGGEIVVIPGNRAQVAAPVAGTVLKSHSGVFPPAGKIVKKGEDILRLLMLPPEKEILGAQEEVTVREEEYAVAQAKADRAEKLFSSKAISEKAVEEIQAELARARAALKGAKGRLSLLSGEDPDLAAINLSTLVLESPFDGVLQRIFVAPSQTVPAATLLFEVAKINPLWVRVPIYVGDLTKIDKTKNASVKPLGTDLRSISFEANPVQGPPLSDAGSASADLFFEVTNENNLFRIGQKVKVSLLQKTAEKNLVVPESALLYDIYGGNWIYIKMAPHVYSRRRVEVSYIVNNIVVLSRGLKEGEEVVVSGVAEIFGTEFGVGK